MEEKNLDADQRIELIQQMIRGTRQRLSFGSSNLFLLWGYLLAATAIVIFVLLKTTDCRTWLWLWLPAATTGGAVTWWHNRFRAPQVKSYTDRLLEQIWSCIASLVVLSAILICGYDPWAVDPLFPALLLIGAGNAGRSMLRLHCATSSHVRRALSARLTETFGNNPK